MAIRVFHGDDSDAFRYLVAELLADDDLVVVGGARSADELLEGVERERPDVVLLDQLGDAGLLEALRERAPNARVIVLSGHRRGDGDPAFAAHADAYLVKTAGADEIRAAVRGG